jgi:hypothetical protein
MNVQEVIKEVKTRNVEWRAFHQLPKTKKYMVIDYEGASNKRPYNVGIVIGDKNRIYYKTSLIIPEFLEENLTSTNMTAYAMAVEISEMEKNPNYKGEFQRVSKDNYIKLLFALIDRYQIGEIWAYNVIFDKNATLRLMADNMDCWKYLKDVLKIQWCDIQREIFHTKLNKKKYIDWCIANNYLTPCGNIQTKEEVVYRYLFGDNNYIEKHIGVYDALDEYQILLVALRQKQKRYKEEKGTHLYTILNRTMQELGM